MKSLSIIKRLFSGQQRVILAVTIFALVLSPTAAYAQGSIFGSVQNSDVSTPANGEMSFFGFLNDTDEEIRIETSDGAGYDSGNWFDDFQNYLTEAAGNPYDYYFVNIANGEAYHLAKLIPSNSFQQEDIVLETASLPSAPTSLSAIAVSGSSMLVSWSGQAGLTYHVYRRDATSNGSFFRIDDVAGDLGNPGVSDEFFYDNTVDGVSSYTYLVIAEDASVQYSRHSAPVTGNSASANSPAIASIDPTIGVTIGGTITSISGSDFDVAGATITFGGISATSVTVVSPELITATTPAGTAGAVDVVVTNTASGLSNTLTGGFTYYVNTAPVADAGSDQLGQFKNTLITLDGSGSSDIDGDDLSYHWSQASGPETVIFSDSNAVDPTFTVATNGNYTFDLTVDDAIDESLVDQVLIEVVERAPVLAAIGPQSVIEGDNLNFVVSSSDPDGTTPTLTAEDIPVNATFLDNGDGTGTFDFDPDFTQAGVLNVRFIVTDGVLADTEIVAVTVNEAGNQAPVLAAIGSQSVVEDDNLNIVISSSDPDATTPTLTAEDIPVNATFLDNGDGTGTFDFNPDFTQAGVFNVRFIAFDGALADTEIVAVTVTEIGNQVPVLDPIGSQVVAENANLNIVISASDPDGTTPNLTADNIPANATFLDNGDGTGTFDFNPGFAQSGIFSVIFVASDGALADTEIVAITVTEIGNQAPVLAAIGSQSVIENDNLNIVISSSDPDATTPTLTAEDIPVNATFLDNGDGTGVFDFNPDFTQAGVYNVRFIAFDGVLADTEIVAVTVTEAGNQAPVLAAIGPQSVVENDNLNIVITSSDPDATTPTLTAEDIPVNATFLDNGDGTGVFDFNPDFTQAGVYNVRFIAFDGALADTEVVAVTVTEVGNQAPVLAAIGSQSVVENDNLNIVISSSDPDATTPTLTAEDIPVNATFLDNGDGTGVFDFNPDFTQAGVYNVRFIASDGASADTEMVAVTVTEVGNQAPVLAAIGSQSVVENDNLNFGVSASDLDGTTPALTAEDIPVNATFFDNGDGTGVFDFNPDFTQAGIYNVRFIASDGALADTEIVAITVNEAGNQAPVLAAIGSQSVVEDDNLNIVVSSSDPDATTPTLTAEDIPVNATFLDNGDGTGVFDFNPDFTQAGVYNVRFIAFDGALADTEIVAVTVTEIGNQAPVLAAIGSQSVVEDDNLNIVISSSDPDATTPILTAEDIPVNATFLDNGDGTGVFDFNPDFTQAGVYNVRFIASDGALADTEVVAVTVTEIGNQAPVLAAIGAQSVVEDDNLNIVISSSDPDATTPTLTAEDIPVNATFLDNGDGTGTFDFNPDFTQAGVFNVRFIAFDGALADTEMVAVTVTEIGNQAPVLAAIGSQSVVEDDNLNFGVSASDLDGTTPALTAEDVPTNATFLDNGDGTGVFDFNPDFTQAGVYNVRFIASDGALADTEIVAVTVTEIGNQAPVLAAIGSQSVVEDGNLNIVITSSDPDATTPTLTAEDIPVNATFLDNGDGTGVFDFNPDFTQAAVYNVRFIAFDGALADTEIVAVTVTEAGNQAPVLAAIGSQSVVENDNLNIVISSSDPDATTPTLTAEDIPVNATFLDNGDGTGVFDFNPDFTQAGVFNVRFIAFDGALADTEVVAVTVTEVGNQVPVLAAIGSQSVVENDNLNFGVSASDLDGTTPALTAEDVPTNATFLDNGDGTGVFDFNPDFTQAGAFNVRFIASDGALADTEIVAIDVTDFNPIPVLDPVGDLIVTEGSNLNVIITSSDLDGAIPILTAEDIPVNATFTDNGDGTGTFDFNTDFTQGGNVYNVLFIASDGNTADSESVQITVTDEGDQAPVIVVVDTQYVAETDSVSFTVSATDPEGATATFTAENVPTNATFVDNGDGTGLFDFHPDLDQAGEYTVSFIASDGALTDTGNVVIIVSNVNQGPTLDPIGPMSVNILSNLNFVITSTDPDSTPAVLTAENLPQFATFTDLLDDTGIFDFTPDETQGGVYFVTFIADDGEFADTEIVQITVTDLGNLPPVFEIVDSQFVSEGGLLEVLVSATDPEGSPVVLYMINGLDNATFVDSGNGVGLFSFQPDFYQAGNEIVSFAAVDDGDPQASGLLDMTITIYDANQPPEFALVGPQSVLLGDSLVLQLVATDSTDADGGSLIMSALKKPANSVFVDSGDGIGGFVFWPDELQIGVDTAIFICYDDDNPQLSGVLNVEITVVYANQPPVLAPIGPQTLTEGDTLILNIYATDPDGPFITLETVALPRNATFVDSGNGVGTLTFMPDYLQSGLESIMFTATDGMQTDDETVLIQIYDNPQPPIITVPNDTTITEGETLVLLVSGIDPDSTTPAFLLDTLVAPLNATFVDSGNGFGTLTFSPVFVQAGVYDFTIYAVDETELSDTGVVTVTILDAGNQLPFFTRLVRDGLEIPFEDTVFATELDSLGFELYTTDADSISPLLTASGMPGSAAYIDNQDFSGSFGWNTTYSDSGTYTITFFANDGDDPSVADTVEITVVILNYNQIPAYMLLYRDGSVWLAGDNEVILEGEVGNYGVEAFDGDSITPLIRVYGLDVDADSLLPLYDNVEVTFIEYNYTEIVFSPDFFQSRVDPYVFRVIAKDAQDTTVFIQRDFEVTVNNNPQVPVLDPILPVTVTEGDSIDLVITYADLDALPGSSLILSYSPQPENSGILAIDENSSDFHFYPWFDQAGVYDIRFQVMDAFSDIDSQTVRFEVIEAGPQAPILYVPFPANFTVNVGSPIDERIFAIDPEGDAVALSVIDIPLNAAFVDSGNGAGSFAFDPDVTQANQTFSVTFIASDGTLADSVIVDFFIQEFICGDVSDDGIVDIDDIVFLIGWIFGGGEAPEPLVSGDVHRMDCPDILVDIDDVVHIVEYIFGGGAAPDCNCP